LSSDVPGGVSELHRSARHMKSLVPPFSSRESRIAVSQLISVFRRNGYVRSVNAARRRLEGQGYKKGYEIRFVATSESEADRIRRWIELIGWRPGASFVHANQIRIPVYGRDRVATFLRWMGVDLEVPTLPPSRGVSVSKKGARHRGKKDSRTRRYRQPR